jgi:hypothetical protein
MNRNRSVGALPEGLPEDHQRFLNQLRQQIEQVRVIALQGGGAGAAGSPIAGTPGVEGPPGPPGDPGGTYTPDLTAPPTPSGVDVTAGITFVAIETDAPVFSEGHGYLRTHVYGAKWPSGSAPTFASAVLVHEFAGSFSAFPTDPNTRWCIWLKWVSVDGVESTSPSGGTNGHQATTGQDVSQLLAVLAGQITASALHSTLGTRIDLIDAPDSTSGSVAQRVKTETDARIAAVSAEAALRTSGDSSTLGSAQSYTQTWAYSRAQSDSAIAASASSLTTAYQGADATVLTNAQSYVNTYAYSRASVDGSLSALDTTLRAAFAAADATTLSSSQAYTNSYTYARATTDAISGNLTTLTARVNNGNAAAFSPQISWQFDGDLGGWAAYSGSGEGAVSVSSVALIAVANTNAVLVRNLAAAEQFLGGRADKVRMRVRRTAGSGWDGSLFYGTPGHGDHTGFYKQIAEPSWGTDGWAIAEWDMTSLTAGGSDWTANTIQRLRFDLVRSSAGTTFEVDWIAVGTRAFGVSTAALQQEATVRASETGALFAQWTVKLDVNGYVSGFGLASTGGSAAPFSEFIIRADQFAIAPVQTDNTAADGSPFFYRTSATTINGVSVPAGGYMKAAYIHDATINTAKIQDLAVTNAKVLSLSVAKLTAGSIAVGQYVRSATYVSGASGFTIEGNGFAEFNNVVVRGTVHASAGTFAGTLSAATGSFSGTVNAAAGAIGGITIDSGGVQSSNYTSGPSGVGFRLQGDGTCVLPATAVRGKLTASQIESPVVAEQTGIGYTTSGGADGTWISGNPFPHNMPAFTRSTASSVIYARASGYISVSMVSGFFDVLVPKLAVSLKLMNSTTGLQVGATRTWNHEIATSFYGSDVYKWPFEVNAQFSGALSGAGSYFLRAEVTHGLFAVVSVGGARLTNTASFSTSALQLRMDVSESNA